MTRKMDHAMRGAIAGAAPPRKWPMPIMAHLVYGTATAPAYEALEELTS